MIADDSELYASTELIAGIPDAWLVVRTTHYEAAGWSTWIAVQMAATDWQTEKEWDQWRNEIN